MRNTHFPGRSPVYSLDGMASTSHPLATKAAIDILSKGGNAIDAAVTAASVLAVVEPHSTGVGGDLFCLYHSVTSNKVLALNASGRAPEAISLDKLNNLGIKADIPFQSPHSVSIPTGVAGWIKLIEDHGRLSLKEILERLNVVMNQLIMIMILKRFTNGMINFLTNIWFLLVVAILFYLSVLLMPL